MVRTEDTGKKKKAAAADSAKPRKDTEKASKGASSDKKKLEAASGKSSSQKAKDSSRDRPVPKESEVKGKALSKQAPAKPPSQAQPKKSNDYLGDIDLPSSSDEEEGPEANGHQPLFTGEEKEQDLKPKVRPSTWRPPLSSRLSLPWHQQKASA